MNHPFIGVWEIQLMHAWRGSRNVQGNSASVSETGVSKCSIPSQSKLEDRRSPLKTSLHRLEFLFIVFRIEDGAASWGASLICSQWTAQGKRRLVGISPAMAPAFTGTTVSSPMTVPPLVGCSICPLPQPTFQDQTDLEDQDTATLTAPIGKCLSTMLLSLVSMWSKPPIL